MAGAVPCLTLNSVHRAPMWSASGAGAQTLSVHDLVHVYGPGVSRRLAMERERLRRRAEHGDPSWPPLLAIALTIGMHYALTSRVTVGPRWLVPAVEAVLLIMLATLLPRRVDKHVAGHRRFALAVIAVVSLANVVSLGLLVHYLVAGGHIVGHQLIASGALLWLINVLLFSVWYWEMDGGGPGIRHVHPAGTRDFQFPQMQDSAGVVPGWRAGYGDYLYTSLTNATAFSPTDAMPLTQSLKLVMAIQSVSALATIGLVIARAVNILG